MKAVSYTWFLVLLLSSFSWAGNADINIDMFVGQVEVLGVHTDIERVAIGAGSLIRLDEKRGELIVIAQAPGSTSLRIWKENGQQLSYNLRITKNDPETRVRMETMVRINVKIVEVRKSAVRNLGLDWIAPNSGQAAGPALTAVGDFASSNLFRSASNVNANLPLNVEPFSTHFGIATSLSSQINFLASNGDAFTLAEPNLSCVNGGSAEFLAGGEIPYPVTGQNGQTSVEFKDYGIMLEINPLVDNQGNIYATVMTEVSQIDPSVSVLGAPGLITRRSKTEMNIVNGQTIAISGLINGENSQDVNKFPFLGSVPILGQLFRSTRYRNQLTELVIFVTPEVVEPSKIAFTDREQNIMDYQGKQKAKIIKTLKFNLMD